MICISRFGIFQIGIENWRMPKSPAYEKLHQCLTQARVRRQFTQVDLASSLGKPQSYVSKYESGERRLDVIEFMLICKALSVKPGDVLKQLDI